MLRLFQSPDNVAVYLPDSERFVPPLPSPWPVVYICTGDSGTRFSPETQEESSFASSPH